MKKIIIFVFCFYGAIVCVTAQQPTPLPTPHGTRRVETSPENRNRAEVNSGFEALENIAQNDRENNSEYKRIVAFENIRKLYRKPNKKEMATLAPNQADLEKYADFLRGTDTGLIKLVADKDCGGNPNILDVSEECLKYSMPGAGAAYSFRTKNHCVTSLSDLIFKDNSFQSVGNLTNGIFVNVGDVSLEQISLQTKGAKYLTDLQTSTFIEEVIENYKLFNNGVKKDGFFYGSSINVQENTTYILRSIAYSGKSYRMIQGYLYDEFTFDKRKDKIVAFRIISRDQESVTIIWKQLSEKKSPTVKSKYAGKGEKIFK